MFNEFVSYGFGFFSQSAQSMKLGLRLCGVTSSAGHTAEAGRTQRIPFPCSALSVRSTIPLRLSRLCGVTSSQVIECFQPPQVCYGYTQVTSQGVKLFRVRVDF